jgi:hypothetical protein
MTIYDPGADMAVRYPDWVVRSAPLGAVPELLCRTRRVILLDDRLRGAERRCALAHAVAHLDLGHWLAMDRRAETLEEQAADDLAAERLMPIELLADIGVWSLSRGEAAAELDVTEHLLLIRWYGRSAAETGYIERRLAAREGAA